jgi:hypothetical protein
MRCPVCRAENSTGPQCRRCRADLALLFVLEAQRRRVLDQARAAVHRGDGPEAARLAAAAHALRRGEDSRRLLALGRLLQQDFAGAWRCYRDRAESPAATPPTTPA